MSILHRATKKLLIAVAGGLVVILGIVMIPYPGPGWLVVFLGLAILATEFVWAKRLLNHARAKYDVWQAWFKHQTLLVKALIGLMTFIIAVLILWVINGYGILVDFFHLPFPWLRSPLL
jgi:uncharacterized protein (TIGR02611 family)